VIAKEDALSCSAVIELQALTDALKHNYCYVNPVLQSD